MTVRARIASSVSSAIYKDSRDVWQNILLRVSINEKKWKLIMEILKETVWCCLFFGPCFRILFFLLVSQLIITTVTQESHETCSTTAVSFFRVTDGWVLVFLCFCLLINLCTLWNKQYWNKNTWNEKVKQIDRHCYDFTASPAITIFQLEMLLKAYLTLPFL